MISLLLTILRNMADCMVSIHQLNCTILCGSVLSIIPIFVSTNSWCCDHCSLFSVQPTHNMTSEHQLGQISQSTIWYLCLTTDSSCVLWLELPSAQPMQSTEHVPRNFLNHSRDFLSKSKQDLHPTWRDTKQPCGGKNEVGCPILRRKVASNKPI